MYAEILNVAEALEMSQFLERYNDLLLEFGIHPQTTGLGNSKVGSEKRLVTTYHFDSLLIRFNLN